MINKLYTIGVYGSSEEHFFDKLISNQIDVFCDIRRRRGLRGSKYSFANKTYLINKLESLNITYLYAPELAPSNELRNRQKLVDKDSHTLKSSRLLLSSDFISGYQDENLIDTNLAIWRDRIPESSNNTVLFCVEQQPEACHRFLAASYISKHFNIPLIHL